MTVSRKMDLNELVIGSNSNEKVDVDYVFDFSNSVVTVSFSRKVMVDRYEPSEVSIGIEVPVDAKNKEELREAAKELLSLARDAAMPFIQRLEDLKQANNR